MMENLQFYIALSGKSVMSKQPVKDVFISLILTDMTAHYYNKTY